MKEKESSERIDDLMNGRVVIQNPAYFCFGIDAVLLAHYPRLRKNDRVMDLGCASGVISLIMSTEAEKLGFDKVRFDGLELVPELADMGVRSVERNGCAESVRIIRGDLREVKENFRPMEYTLVTCNPPYTAAGHGIPSESEPVDGARHETSASLEEVVRAASYLLKNTGRFAMVHRPARLPEILETLRKYHLEPKRLRMVYPYLGKDANMVLIESVKCGKPFLKAEPPLIVYDKPGQYTQEILRIYGME